MNLQELIHEQFLEYSTQLEELEKEIILKLKAGEDYSKDVKKAAGLKLMKEEAVRMMARSSKPYIHQSNKQEKEQ